MSRQIAYLPYRRAFRKPLRTAHGVWAVREGFIVRVEEKGLIGYGEIAPIPDFGSETVAAAETFLMQWVQQPGLPVPAELPCCAFAASAALGMALGNRPPVSRYPVAALLPAGISAIEQLQGKASLGYTAFKWKIGVESVDVEQAVFHQLLSMLPADSQLRLDANASLDEASLLAWLEAIDSARTQVEYIEQPLAVGEELLMAELMASSGVPIALDESLNGVSGADWLAKWVGPLVIKPALMGDVAKLCGRLAPVADRVVLSSVFETSVGLANALCLADQLGADNRAIGFDTLDAFEDSLQSTTSAPFMTSETSAAQLDQLWKTLLRSK